MTMIPVTIALILFVWSVAAEDGFPACMEACVTTYYQHAMSEGYTNALRAFFRECTDKCVCMGGNN